MCKLQKNPYYFIFIFSTYILFSLKNELEYFTNLDYKMGTVINCSSCDSKYQQVNCVSIKIYICMDIELANSLECLF